MRTKWKDQSQQLRYDLARQFGADNFSSFFVAPEKFLGPRMPRRGAGDRSAYWNGWNGNPLRYLRGSMAHAFWAAGRDARRDNLKGVTTYVRDQEQRDRPVRRAARITEGLHPVPAERPDVPNG